MITTHRRALAASLSLTALLVLPAQALAEGEGEHSHAHAAPASAAAKASAANALTMAEDSLPLDPRFSPNRIAADVAFLADDLLEGRDTASRGHEIAARFVAQRFAALGLEPAGDMVDGKRGWIQQVTLQKTTLEPDKVAMTLTGADGISRALKLGDDFVIRVNPRKLEAAVEAPLVFAGYGLVDKALGLDDYAGLDVRGKVVVLLNGIPDGIPSEEAAYLGMANRRIAQERGALAVIAVDTEASGKLYSFAARKRSLGQPSYTWVGPDGLADTLTPDLAVNAVVSSATAEALFAGAPRSYAKIRREAARKGARPKGFALPGTISARVGGTAERVTSPNVVAVLRGSDPVLRDEYVALSGHLDHIGISPGREGDAPDKDRINNGVLDNAAGSAVTLEVARVFAEGAQKPRRSLLFLLSTGEEKGLLGAGYYAANPTVPSDSIVADVDLDMPVLLYPFTDLTAFGGDHSSIGPITAKAIAPMGLKISPDPMPAEGIFVRSDHYEFVKRGVPAIFLATGFANGGEAAWGQFFAKGYHQPGDDMNQALNWRAGARFAEANWRITDAIANADTAPLWYAGDYFGDLFAPAAPRAPKP